MSVRARSFLSHSENALVSMKIFFYTISHYADKSGNNDQGRGVRICKFYDFRGRVPVFANILKMHAFFKYIFLL